MEHGSTVHGVAGVLLAGGIAGVVCWASVFPLDMIKTSVQTQETDREGEGAWEIVRKEVYRTDGSSCLLSWYRSVFGPRVHCVESTIAMNRR